MQCPKCQGSMETGVILDSQLLDYTRATCWIAAQAQKLGTQADSRAVGQYEVDAYRCIECGFLEMYAGGDLKE
ncbi:MAG: hypothetical protein GY930_02680 [bacterium]|nr:hypothetical protein [bacterium]